MTATADGPRRVVTLAQRAFTRPPGVGWAALLREATGWAEPDRCGVDRAATEAALCTAGSRPGSCRSAEPFPARMSALLTMPGEASGPPGPTADLLFMTSLHIGPCCRQQAEEQHWHEVGKGTLRMHACQDEVNCPSARSKKGQIPPAAWPQACRCAGERIRATQSRHEGLVELP